jgi:D-3-phosphoglycerate dehydrogenase
MNIEKPHVSFLDRYHPDIYATIERELPKHWTHTFAASSQLADQIAAAENADLLFVMAAPVTPDIISSAKSLRLIQKLGVGVDRIDQKLCSERGIAIARIAGGNSIPVAEHTLLLILATLRHLPSMDRKTREGAWLKEEARGVNRHLFGKTVGLVGLGAIGRALVKLLTGFGVNIVYYDPAVSTTEVEGHPVRSLPLDEVLATSDIVSLHLPLLPQTAGLISEEKIALMKRDAVLINCARGGLVDEAALYRALTEGRLMGAGIDAFSKEPPVGSPLLQLEQVVVTPHLAGATLDNFASVMRRAVSNATQYLAGEGLPKQDAILVPSGSETIAGR